MQKCAFVHKFFSFIWAIGILYDISRFFLQFSEIITTLHFLYVASIGTLVSFCKVIAFPVLHGNSRKFFLNSHTDNKHFFARWWMLKRICLNPLLKHRIFWNVQYLITYWWAFNVPAYVILSNLPETKQKCLATR